MKFFLFITFILTGFAASAQFYSSNTPEYFLPNPKTKITVRLMNDSVVKGQAMKITDSSITLLLHQDSLNSVYQTINVSQIKFIKIKQNAFWIGAGAGAAQTQIACKSKRTIITTTTA